MRPTIVHVMEPDALLAELAEHQARAKEIAHRLDMMIDADLQAASDHAYRLADAIRSAIKSREDA